MKEDERWLETQLEISQTKRRTRIGLA